MELSEAIKTRRSIRSFKKDKVPDDLLEKIIEAGAFAPSSHNTRPWEFIIIKDKTTIEKLSRAHEWSAHIKGAPVVIVACGNLKKRDHRGHIFPCMVSVALAVENMLLTITSLGLGTCWTYIRNPEHPEAEKNVREILSLPDHILPLCMLPVGYPAVSPKKKKIIKTENIIHYGKYSEKS